MHAGDDDQPVAAEQRGRQDVGQLTDRQARRGQLVHLGVGVAAEHRGADGGDRARAQQLLLAHHHAQAGGGFHGFGRHVCMVSRGDDGPAPGDAATGLGGAPSVAAAAAPASLPARRRPTSSADPDDGQVALPVGAVHPHAGLRQPGQQPAGRVAVGVVGADRDQRHAGAAGGEELRVGVRAAVVRHLEHVGPQIDAAGDDPRLGLGARGRR